MRWLDPEITTPATTEPVSLEDGKAQVRVDDDESDALITGYLLAARSYAEQVTGLRLATQTIVLRAWGLDACPFRLPTAPIQSITSITYLDQDGARQTLDPATYVADLNGIHPAIALAYNKQWPAHLVQMGSVEITAVTGFADDACPTPIKQAILLCVGDWFANRETTDVGRVQAIEMVAVDALLANFHRALI